MSDLFELERHALKKVMPIIPNFLRIFSRSGEATMETAASQGSTGILVGHE